MTTRLEAEVDWTQVFNAENRLASVSNGTDTWTFVYDGDGNRVKQVNPDGSITLLLGGGIYTVEDAIGTPEVTKYYSIAGQRVAMESAAGLQFLLTDHLGSVAAVTNAAGGLLGEQRYLPLGSERLTPDIGETDFGFTGQRDLAAMGLMDYNARFYSAGIGRFTQADTIVPQMFRAQSLNRFAYVENRPLNFIDPSGHGLCSSIDGTCTTTTTTSSTGGGGSGGGGTGPTCTTCGGYQEPDDVGSSPTQKLSDDLSGEPDPCGGLQFICDAYSTRANNYSMAWTIINHPNAQHWQRILALQYLTIDVGGHALLAGGIGLLGCSAFVTCVKAAEGALGVGATLCADGDCTNEGYTVYRLVETGVTRYIGMTSNFARRAAEHMSSSGWPIRPIPGLTNLTYTQARAVEQVLIENYGLPNLYNQINSIASSNPFYPAAVNTGTTILQSIGFP